MTERSLPAATDLVDRLIGRVDKLLRAGHGVAVESHRPSPAPAADDDVLSEEERREAARLMRVNHAGEIAAQALYEGQALTARDGQVRAAMQESASEEADHLAWCAQRIDELGGTTSRLDPLWYLGSLGIGAAAGLLGDRVSLGFLAETERQVVQHLEAHLARLPDADARSRAVLAQMQADEAAHSAAATAAGGAELPGPVRGLMRLVSKVMTRTAYWV